MVSEALGIIWYGTWYNYLLSMCTRTSHHLIACCISVLLVVLIGASSASTVTAEELGIFILSVWGPILRRQSGVVVEHSSQPKNSI